MNLHIKNTAVDPETTAIALMGATVVAMLMINLVVHGTPIDLLAPWLFF
jgi:hypothetical protein